jgi:hypothetical protein
MPIPTKKTANDIIRTIETVNNMHGRPRQETRRRLRNVGGGGSSLFYVEITASTSISEYTATIFDNPTDRVSVEVGVTVYAKQHDAGTIPNSASGQGFWAIKGNDDKYYINNYSVFYG